MMQIKTVNNIIVRVQLLVSFILIIIFALIQNIAAAKSLLLASLVVILPNCLFLYQYFKNKDNRTPQQIVKAFYKGEVIKLIGTTILLILIFNFCQVNAIIFFSSYIVLLFCHWLVFLF